MKIHMNMQWYVKKGKAFLNGMFYYLTNIFGYIDINKKICYNYIGDVNEK